MKKNWLPVLSTLVSQIANATPALAQTEKLHKNLTQYFQAEGQKAEHEEINQANVEGVQATVVIRKLRRSFKHLDSYHARVRAAATSSSGPTTSTCTSSTGTSCETAPVPSNPIPDPTSSTGQPNPPTASSGPCFVDPSISSQMVRSYQYQIVLKTVLGKCTAESAAPYIFANRLGENEATITYDVYRFHNLNDISHPQARALLTVRKANNQMSFSSWMNVHE